MKTLILADNVNAAAVANQAAVQPLATPFLAGRDVVAVIDASGASGTPNLRIQGSDDNITYVDLAVSSGATALGHREFNIKLRPYMRFGVFTAAGAGTVSAYCINGA